ncbi:uncharacterized membrane-anchored protein YjiN (DUF445 family) [Kineococcus xinjiangensis]|uniref:Uncharacterized membrane-anchored protein YjiN (DUF445 family) n=1 Tax=Kineococcus xinjiangensis TaxID=512762 RepID=A0A2S6IW89_9ACTN|nr:DUF445 domain-containing protein [Kineococcus xinjiangensis]PPK98627.1 uncharacterized membrane-anchored protein YjiN (DUF445 family) [Kineococcus xinjiangensis]
MTAPAPSPPATPPPVVPFLLSAADEERRAALRRMRVVAGSLLVLAAVVYALTIGTDGALGYVNAAAEAAMVGAVADWFAVTALFRRPFGLPIPHTGLIPRKKDALGQSLEEFVSSNFLAEEVVRDKVARAEVTRRLAEWLVRPGSAERAVEEAAVVVGSGLKLLKDDEVAILLDQVVLQRLADEPWSPAAGRLLAQVVADGTHHPVVDVCLREAQRWLDRNEHTVMALVMERAPSWTPGWLDERIGRRVHGEALRWVTDALADQHHSGRKAIDDLLARFARDLQHDATTRARALEFQRRLLTHPDVRDTLAGLWGTVRRLLTEAVADPGSELRLRAVKALRDLAQRLLDDDALRGRIDGHVVDAAGHLVRRFAPELATVISDTVARWDGADAARRIELHVGRDLQFIRINGTVVGGLVGVLIHALTQLAGH